MLDGVLDTLDRLFDRDSTVSDLRALLYATSEAVADTRFDSVLAESIRKLGDVRQSNKPLEDQRDAALLATGEFRLFIAGILNQDAGDNPKRRHTQSAARAMPVKENE